MTEETNQTTTDQSAQQLQQPVQEEMTTIYASTNAVPFAAMLIPKKWAKIANVYPMTTIQPDPSLKSPKMDWNEMKWFENDNAQNGIDMENLKQQVETLKSSNQEANAKIDQLIRMEKLSNAQLGKLQANVAKPANTANTTNTVTSTTKGGNK